jgi:hypothetical protein
MLGREVYKNNNINNTELVIYNLPKEMLIFKINIGGEIVTKKYLK